MNEEQQPDAIFGLNFLQEMKGVSDSITGAYDPEQEVWLDQVQGGALPGGLTPGRPPSPSRSQDSIRSQNPPTKKKGDTVYITDTQGGGDSDHYSDYDV